MAASELSAEQQKKIESLRETVTDKLQASPELRVWCANSCLQRYLRARDWDVSKATKQLHKSIEWRQSYKPDSIRWEDIQEEAKTGKAYLGQHRDLDGRPVIIMRPRNENSKNVERQLKFLVYNLELASRRADETGVGKMTWLIDFVGYSYRNAPPIKLSLHALHLLQSHYPERLGLAVCYHPPMLFSLTWKATSPFIDPVTYRKIHFVDKDDKGRTFMSEKFGGQHLESCLGGQNAFVFDYESHGHQMREEDAKLQRNIKEAASS